MWPSLPLPLPQIGPFLNIVSPDLPPPPPVSAASARAATGGVQLRDTSLRCHPLLGALLGLGPALKAVGAGGRRRTVEAAACLGRDGHEGAWRGRAACIRSSTTA